MFLSLSLKISKIFNKMVTYVYYICMVEILSNDVPCTSLPNSMLSESCYSLNLAMRIFKPWKFIILILTRRHFFSLLLEREEDGELTGCLLAHAATGDRPATWERVPWLGFVPMAFPSRGWLPSQLSHTSQGYSWTLAKSINQDLIDWLSLLIVWGRDSQPQYSWPLGLDSLVAEGYAVHCRMFSSIPLLTRFQLHFLQSCGNHSSFQILSNILWEAKLPSFPHWEPLV